MTNHETARKTTATNVTAKLVMPPHFAAIGGSMRSTASLAWSDSWTAEWVVHSPFFIPFGTKTFDVVVWSDNLGVAVDDFYEATASSPLYHPVRIFVSFVKIDIIDYLEAYEWWPIAVPRFPGLSEPREILRILPQLSSRYKSPDDVALDPEQTLEAARRLHRVQGPCLLLWG